MPPMLDGNRFRQALTNYSAAGIDAAGATRLRQGTLTAINTDGTVEVSIEADPVSVPATIANIPGYHPAEGDLVMVTYDAAQGWAHVHHQIAAPGQNAAAATTPASSTGPDNDVQSARRVISVFQSATPAINTDKTDVASITGLAQAITSMTTGLTGTPGDGNTLVVRITDNGTARAITWGASWESSQIALPTTTTASALLIVGFMWNIVTPAWRCVAVA